MVSITTHCADIVFESKSHPCVNNNIFSLTRCTVVLFPQPSVFVLAFCSPPRLRRLALSFTKR